MELTDEQVVVQLGLQMKKFRKQKGLTQLDVASRCNIEESAYRRVENAKSSPTLKTILLIARALNVSVLELFSFMDRER